MRFAHSLLLFESRFAHGFAHVWGTEDPRDLYERRVGGAGSVGQPNGQAEEIARFNRRKQANSSIFGGEEEPVGPAPGGYGGGGGGAPVSSGGGGGGEYQFGLEYDGPPIPGACSDQFRPISGPSFLH